MHSKISTSASTQNLSDVTCPFCGLACDDLVLENSALGLSVAKYGCAIAAASFQAIGHRDALNAAPRVAGRATTWENAIAAAAKILVRAKAPLIAGFGTDVSGARATLALADRIGALVDHMNMPAKLRNILTVQNSGWITTTLAEIKNRADFVLVIGNAAVNRFPRFLERAVWPQDAMFADRANRKVFFLGEVDGVEINAPATVTRLHCDHASLSRIMPALRAIVNEQPIGLGQFASSDIQSLQNLAAQMHQARYGVIVWAASDFDFPHGELTIQTLAEMIKDLNKTIRFAGFPLGGSDGDLSSNGTQTWQTGLPLRSRYGRNGIDYDPYRYGTNELLAAGEVDAMLWVSSFDATRTPPATDIPQIVLGPPGMVLPREPEVFIPVGTPGVHHGGHFIRTDKVVVMRLNKLIDNELTSVADVASRLLQELARITT